MTKGTIRYDLCLRMVSCTIGLYTIRRERVRMIHHLSTWAIYSNFALKKWKIHQGESFEGRLTLAPIEKTTPPLRRATPVPWSMVHQYSRNAPGTKSQALHAAHTSLIAVIFKGSCAPLYSSPRTKGVKTPDLAFLIWG